jgi:hypothetical protein
MIDVFIGYGGPRAENVANDLGNFLRDEEVNVFLATPSSPSLHPTAEWRIEIDKSLLNCNVAVFVCHQGTPRSYEVRREIKFLFDLGQEQKIISFTTHKNCIPRQLRDRWNPFHFPPENPDESFCRLLNQIFRCYIRNSKQITPVPEDENERRDE